MNAEVKISDFVVGLNIPAEVGMAEKTSAPRR